jgi:hypothetical protein
MTRRGPRGRGPSVEVGGIEPPSHEASAPASPSAADNVDSEPGGPVGQSLRALAGGSLPAATGVTAGASCIALPGPGEAGTPRVDTLR